jgi:hypothetical protein
MTRGALLIARNTLRGVLSRYALYLWGAAVVLMLLRAAPAIFMDADNASRVMFRARAVIGAIEMWSTLCIVAAIVLGAGSIASEIASKTLITVIARPIARWEVLVGRWFGVTAFALVSLALGLAIGLGIVAYAAVDIDYGPLALAVTHHAVAIVLYGACAVALSAAGSSARAAAFTILLVFLPGIIGLLKDDTGGVRRSVGVALEYVTPAGVASHFNAAVRLPAPGQRQRNPIDYGAERGALLDNVAHAAAYLIIGGFFFSRKDVHL